MKIKIFQRKFNQGTGSFGAAVGIFAFLLTVSLTILVLPANSGAKDWPTRPITIICPWAAGAAPDILARTMSPKISKILGVPVQVVNKPGAGGIIGTLEAVKSLPDGYTLLADIGAISSIQYAWSKDLPYKVEERTFISMVIMTPHGLVVSTKFPWKTVEELVNAIRTDPSSISFANIGGTGTPDVCIAQFRAAMAAKGVDVSKLRPISYKGTGEALPFLAGGHVTFTFATPSAATPLISAEKIRYLGMTSAERHRDWPNVPTMAEVGYPSVDLLYWSGLCGPPGLPANIVKILDNTVKEIFKDPDFIAKIDKLGMQPFYKTGDEFRKFALSEGEAIKALKLK